MAKIYSTEYINDLNDLYAEYLNAEKAILKHSQEYTVKDRTLKRADLEFIASEKRRIANELAKAEVQGKIRVKRVIIRDDT